MFIDCSNLFLIKIYGSKKYLYFQNQYMLYSVISNISCKANIFFTYQVIYIWQKTPQRASQEYLSLDDCVQYRRPVHSEQTFLEIQGSSAVSKVKLEKSVSSSMTVLPMSRTYLQLIHFQFIVIHFTITVQSSISSLATTALQDHKQIRYLFLEKASQQIYFSNVKI